MLAAPGRWSPSPRCAPAPARANQPAGRSAAAGRRPPGRAGPSSDALWRPGTEWVQRFATLADIDASNPTIEEREEYEEPVRQGMIMYAGVDYRAILDRAEHEAEVLVWDGGNNDFPFFAPDLHICVADPLRPGHELGYHPGETNLRMADVVVINKVDSAEPAAVAAVAANVAAVNPRATVIRAASPVALEPGPSWPAPGSWWWRTARP